MMTLASPCKSEFPVPATWWFFSLLPATCALGCVCKTVPSRAWSRPDPPAGKDTHVPLAVKSSEQPLLARVGQISATGGGGLSGFSAATPSTVLSYCLYCDVTHTGYSSPTEPHDAIHFSLFAELCNHHHKEFQNIPIIPERKPRTD